jgi:hypothetical protein
MSNVRWMATPCLLTVGLLARPAFGMEPAAPEEDFCRSHWFAVAQCHDRPSSELRYMFGLDVGVVRMNESGPFGFGNGIGSVTEAGPSWGVRAGVELLPWLAFEARYVGIRWVNPEPASSCIDERRRMENGEQQPEALPPAAAHCSISRPPYLTMIVVTWLQSPSPAFVPARYRNITLAPGVRPGTVVDVFSVLPAASHVLPSMLYCHS